MVGETGHSSLTCSMCIDQDEEDLYSRVSIFEFTENGIHLKRLLEYSSLDTRA